VISDERSRSDQLAEGSEAIVAPWPSRPKVLYGDAATHAAQYENGDYGVIGIPEDGNEVGDHVDRYGQVDEQQGNPDANPGREVSIGGQSSQQPEQVRKKTQRLLQEVALGSPDG
jgi:hypothetical protein